jgi:hypothetical protein
MAGNIPLVESGTAGYLGQVQPLLKVCKEASNSDHDRHSEVPLDLDRIVPNASIAFPNQHPRLFPCAPFDQRPLSPYIVSFGQKVI